MGDQKHLWPQTGKQNGKRFKVTNLYRQKQKVQTVAHILLPLHLFPGSDTTSAIYRKGKSKLIVLAKTKTEVRAALEVFNDDKASISDIIKAGEKLFLHLYDLTSFKTLDMGRYYRLKQSLARQNLKTPSNLALIPPTSGTAKEHSLRVYLQVQTWLGFDLDPTDWGWEIIAGNLRPKGSERPADPGRLLKLVYCDCKGKCAANSQCRCRKANQKCSEMCGKCYGITCSNASELPEIEDSNES